MIFKSIGLTLFFLLSSCGSHVVLTPTPCQQEFAWGIPTTPLDFKITQVYATPLGLWHPTKIDLIELLKEHNIDCRKIKTISLLIETHWSDVLKTLIPFWSTKTIVLMGNYRNAIPNISTTTRK